MDEKNGEIIIRDYKTSNLSKLNVNAESAFKPGLYKRDYIFQIQFYQFLIEKIKKKTTHAWLIPVSNLFKEKPDTPGISGFEKESHEVFSEKLNEVIQEVLSPETVFDQAENKKICEYCSYKYICNR